LGVSFDAAAPRPASVSQRSLVPWEGPVYSAPPRRAGPDVTAYVAVNDLPGALRAIEVVGSTAAAYDALLGGPL
jgi:hypothetical protein